MDASARLYRIAYNSLLIPLRAAFPLHAWIGRMRGLGEAEFSERLGRLPAPVEPARGAGVWVQAASVGEVGVAERLLAAIHEARPAIPLLLTTMTRTGQRLAQAKAGGLAEVAYAPLDFPAAVRRAMDAVRPALLVLVETELWPNLLLEAEARSVPVVVVNGRIGDRALGRYRFVRPLVRRVLRAISLACVQSDLDADRFALLGLSRDRIRVTGNIKFSIGAASAESMTVESADDDIGAAAVASGKTASDGVEIWVGGSTAEGEEAALLAAFDALPPLPTGHRLLVLAPRRPERFEQVAEILRSRGRPWRRRSEIADWRAQLSPDAHRVPPDPQEARPGPLQSREGAPLHADEVLLLDTLGELSMVYRAASVAFVGGSIAPIGGHNLVEAAALGVAPIFGPHIENTRDAARRLLAAGGAFQVSGAAALAELFARLAADPDLRAISGEKARREVAKNAGALDRTLREVLPVLDAAIASISGQLPGDGAATRRPGAAPA